MQTCDILVIHFNQNDDVDALRQELTSELKLRKDSETYFEMGSTYLSRLRAHKLWCEDTNRHFRLHPILSQYQGSLILGHYWEKTLDSKKVCVFESDLRILNGGPDLPAFQLCQQVIAQTNPRLVIYAGLGAGTSAEQQLGDVVVSASASSEWVGEWSNGPQNLQTTTANWTPPQLQSSFETIQETGLQAASPHYAPAPEAPAPHQPKVIASSLPILTSPGSSSTMPGLASPDPDDRGYRGEVACAVDTDAFCVAWGHQVPCALVVGLASPALHRLPVDFQGTLRESWLTHFWRDYSPQAARNVAHTVHQLIQLA